MINNAFPYWKIDHLLGFLSFLVVWKPPALKKSEPKDSIRPRWGEKRPFVSPQKIFWKTEIKEVVGGGAILTLMSCKNGYPLSYGNQP